MLNKSKLSALVLTTHSHGKNRHEACGMSFVRYQCISKNVPPRLAGHRILSAPSNRHFEGRTSHAIFTAGEQGEEGLYILRRSAVLLFMLQESCPREARPVGLTCPGRSQREWQPFRSMEEPAKGIVQCWMPCSLPLKPSKMLLTLACLL